LRLGSNAGTASYSPAWQNSVPVAIVKGPPFAELEPRQAAIEPAELLERVARNGTAASGLTAWLLAEGCAVQVDGGLAPTARTVELAGAVV